MLVQNNQRNQGKWNIRVVVKLIKGRDGEIHAARLKTGKSYVERAIQQLCPMELSCDIEKVEHERLDPQAREFIPKRERRKLPKIVSEKWLRMKMLRTID